jgi:pimeloyl-ACP methyl ester carboxylesterase
MSAQVAFLPGASGAASFWAPVADRMPAGWSTRLLSWPGAGTEPHDPKITGYEDLLSMAAGKICDNSDLVAQSMGGAIAVGLALRYPRKVRRLVLVATSGGLDVSRLGAEDWRAEYRSEYPDAAAWVTDQRPDHANALSAIEAPVCLIWGDEDRISPPSVGRALNAALADSSLHIVRRGTHMMAHERPAEIAALIIDHLS